MNQGQPRRQQAEESIKCGEVLEVSGNLADKPVTPQDAATKKIAENEALGKIRRSGPASVMQHASAVNKTRGAVGRSNATRATVTTVELEGGQHIITESLRGQDASTMPRDKADPVTRNQQ